MKNLFAPDLYKSFGDHYLWWFAASNRYICVSEQMHKVVMRAFAHKNEKWEHSAQKALQMPHKTLYNREVYAALHEFLADQHNPLPQMPVDLSTVLDRSCCPHVKHYELGQQQITLHYDTQAHLELLHYDLAHLEVANTDRESTEFWLYGKHGQLFLFKAQRLLVAVPETAYHYIQGKFKMHVLCTLYHNTEAHWIGTLHASTVAFKDAATLLIGKSGSGKTTLTGLLVAHGFDLVADDLTALHAKDALVYSYPGALSVKSGSFELMSFYFSALSTLPTLVHHPAKGAIKYLPLPISKPGGYKVKQMLLVNYQPNVQTLMEEISVVEVLEIMVPDSWLAPEKIHAKGFMDWLSQLKFYRLTYSNTAEAIASIKQLHGKKAPVG